MSNKLYDILKKISMLVAPVATLISTLGITWGWPYSTQIAGTFAAIDVFLGAALTISTNQYNKKQTQNQ